MSRKITWIALVLLGTTAGWVLNAETAERTDRDTPPPKPVASNADHDPLEHVEKPDGDKRRGHRGGRRRHYRGLTEEQEKEFLAEIKEKRPFGYRMLMNLKERNSRRYRMVLYQHWLEWQRFQRMPEKVQEAMEDIQDGRKTLVELIALYRRTEDEEEKAKLKSRIRSAVVKIFDADLVVRDHKLSELEERIKQLKKDLAERKENRDDEIDSKVQNLLRLRGRGKK
ncbi:MAG: hypothetical protein ACLFV7_09720 [Phycisphaerae bacterium]